MSDATTDHNRSAPTPSPAGDGSLSHADEPIACTIGGAEVEPHLAVLARLRAAATGVERSRHGVVIRLPSSPGVRADVETFVAVEQRGCRFWGFALAEDGPDLVLRWDGPPATDTFLDRLVDHLRGRLPIDQLYGYL